MRLEWFTPNQVAYVLAEYEKGATMIKLANQFHCGVALIRRLLVKEGVKIHVPDTAVYKPTREQIEEDAAKIREGWTEEERRDREVENPGPVVIPDLSDARSQTRRNDSHLR